MRVVADLRIGMVWIEQSCRAAIVVFTGTTAAKVINQQLLTPEEDSELGAYIEDLTDQ